MIAEAASKVFTGRNYTTARLRPLSQEAFFQKWRQNGVSGRTLSPSQRFNSGRNASTGRKTIQVVERHDSLQSINAFIEKSRFKPKKLKTTRKKLDSVYMKGLSALTGYSKEETLDIANNEDYEFGQPNGLKQVF